MSNPNEGHDVEFVDENGDYVPVEPDRDEDNDIDDEDLVESDPSTVELLGLDPKEIFADDRSDEQ